MGKEDQLVVIFMGSKKDSDFASGIKERLEEFDVGYEARALSAHKAPEATLRTLKKYEKRPENIVYIAVAGKSNALGPMLSANSTRPVINCPPLGRFTEDIYSSLRTPTGVPCTTTLVPENAAIHAVKILSLASEELRAKLDEWRADQQESVIAEDQKLSF
jgi:phosphoribosylaminoimidazole carboxylase PurE protein